MTGASGRIFTLPRFQTPREARHADGPIRVEDNSPGQASFGRAQAPSAALGKRPLIISSPFARLRAEGDKRGWIIGLSSAMSRRACQRAFPSNLQCAAILNRALCNPASGMVKAPFPIGRQASLWIVQFPVHFRDTVVGRGTLLRPVSGGFEKQNGWHR